MATAAQLLLDHPDVRRERQVAEAIGHGVLPARPSAAGSRDKVEVALQSVRESRAPSPDSAEAQDQRARRFVLVIHVGRDLVPPERLIRMPHGGDRRFPGEALPPGRRQQPPGQFPRPSLAPPESAGADDVALDLPLQRPDPEALQVPGTEIGGQARPGGASTEGPAVGPRRLFVRVEACVRRVALDGRRQQAESRRLQRRNDHRGGLGGHAVSRRARRRPAGSCPSTCPWRARRPACRDSGFSASADPPPPRRERHRRRR